MSHKCPYCILTFECDKKLAAHIFDDHLDYKILQKTSDQANKKSCKLCQKTVFCTNFENHLIKDHYQGRLCEILKLDLDCTKCDKSFETTYKTLLHFLKNHDDSKLIEFHKKTCAEFLHNKNQEAPNKVLEDSTMIVKYECELCDNDLKYQKDDFELHLMKEHFREALDNLEKCKFPVTCGDCSSELKDIKFAITHMIEVHKPYQEALKEKSQGDLKVLVKYKLIDIEKSKCNICNKTFDSIDTLKTHFESEHGIVELGKNGSIEGSKFKCIQCDKEFVRKGNFVKHIKIIHGLAPSSDFKEHTKLAQENQSNSIQKNPTKLKPTFKPKSLKCIICNKNFGNNVISKIHFFGQHILPKLPTPYPEDLAPISIFNMKRIKDFLWICLAMKVNLLNSLEDDEKSKLKEILNSKVKESNGDRKSLPDNFCVYLGESKNVECFVIRYLEGPKNPNEIIEINDDDEDEIPDLDSTNTESNPVLENPENDCKNKKCLKGSYEAILEHIASKHSGEMENLLKKSGKTEMQSNETKALETKYQNLQEHEQSEF